MLPPFNNNRMMDGATAQK